MKKQLLYLLLFGFVLAAPSKKEFSQAFIDVAKKTNPAIVSILSEKDNSKEFHGFFFGPDFGDKYGKFPKSRSLGSGVIVDAKKGYIVTNNHVVEDSEDIKVILMDKHELKAEIVGRDPLSDIAILKIDYSNLTDVKMGDSDDLQVGEWVIAIGSPFGLELNHTVTAGIVSAVGRSDVISRRNFENFIQHDAAINPGNSGGALFNLDGELIGINTAIATDGFSQGNAGVGFAIPINQVKRVMEDLIDKGFVSRGWLGVSIQDIDENMARALDLDTRNGAIISQVMEDSPADKYGIEDQDIVIRMNGLEVKDASHLKNLVANAHPGEKVTFTVIRDDDEKDLMVKLGTRPDEEELRSGMYSSDAYDKIGLKVENLDSSSFWDFSDDDEGVVVTDVKRSSNAYEAGVRPGDVIVKIDRNSIESVKDYKDILKDYEEGDPILLLIKRDGGSRFVAFEID